MAAWRAKGIVPITEFSTPGDGMNGYHHLMIFSVPSPEAAFEMSEDIWSSEGRQYWEKLNIVIGQTRWNPDD